jgi:hypothetical protein
MVKMNALVGLNESLNWMILFVHKFSYSLVSLMDLIQMRYVIYFYYCFKKSIFVSLGMCYNL